MKLSISYSTGYPRLCIDGEGDTLIVGKSLDLQALQNIEVKNLTIKFDDKVAYSGNIPSTGGVTVDFPPPYTITY